MKPTQSGDYSGGDIMSFVKRATGNAPSKKDHQNLSRKLREELLDTEKEVQKKEKQQKKLKEQVLVLQSKIEFLNGQIEKSEKIAKSVLGGSKRTTKKKRSNK